MHLPIAAVMDLCNDKHWRSHSNLCFPHFLRFTFGLNKNIQEKLFKSGINLTSEIELFSNKELIEKCDLTQCEVDELICQIKSPPIFSGINLAQWQENESYISSGCAGLDQAFGGKGLPTGRLLQISGEAGAGKSQICMQLCYRVQLSLKEGGLDAEALYIDTEDSFRPARIREMAYNYFRKDSVENSLLNFKTEEVITRIHIRRVNTNYEDLCNIILNGQLEQFFKYHSNVKLLILDSISYHFRYDYDERTDTRLQQLIQIATKLKQFALKYNIAILITNHVALSKNTPALGAIWNSLCCTALLLNRISSDVNIDGDSNRACGIQYKLSQRQCRVLKSPSVCRDYCTSFSISTKGIED